MDKEEKDLIDRKMWNSKQMWQVISAVAVAVFFLTSVFNRFVFVEQGQANQKELHAKDMADSEASHLKDLTVVDDRWRKVTTRLEERIDKLEDVSHKAVGK